LVLSARDGVEGGQEDFGRARPLTRSGRGQKISSVRPEAGTAQRGDEHIDITFALIALDALRLPITADPGRTRSAKGPHFMCRARASVDDDGDRAHLAG
jgi:hypothetical protein